MFRRAGNQPQDPQLQQLTQAWQASGSVEDEAALLRERIQRGQLTQDSLELAAHCWHPATRLVLGRGEKSMLRDLSDVKFWAQRIGSWGRTCELVVASTCAEAALADAARADDVDPAARKQGCALGEQALAAARAAHQQPGPEATRTCDIAAANVLGAWRGTWLNAFHPGCVEAACREALGQAPENGRHFANAVRYLALAIGKQEALSVVARRLVSLALGDVHGARHELKAGISANGGRRIYRVLCGLATNEGQVSAPERAVLDDARTAFQIPPAEAQGLEAESATPGMRIGAAVAEQDALIAYMARLVIALGTYDVDRAQRHRRMFLSFGKDRTAELEARLVRYFPKLWDQSGQGPVRL